MKTGSLAGASSTFEHRPDRRYPWVRLQHSLRRRQEQNPRTPTCFRPSQVQRDYQHHDDGLQRRRVKIKKFFELTVKRSSNLVHPFLSLI